MKRTLLIVLMLLSLFMMLGCEIRGPNDQLVINTIKRLAEKHFSVISDEYDILKITIDNNYKRKVPISGMDAFIYEVTVTLRAKKNFTYDYWKAWDLQLHLAEGLFDKDGRVKSVTKGTTKQYKGTFAFSKYGKEWRYEALDLHGFSFKREFPKEIVQESKTHLGTVQKTGTIGDPNLIVLIIILCVGAVAAILFFKKINEKKVSSKEVNFCSECGTKANPEDNFCQECGKGLG